MANDIDVCNNSNNDGNNDESHAKNNHFPRSRMINYLFFMIIKLFQ